MDSASNVDYRTLISKLIKKQLLILGPDITFVKVKNVQGLTIDANGEILGLVGDPKAIFENLSSQFIALSGAVVKQTLESIHEANPVVATQEPAPNVSPQGSTVSSEASNATTVVSQPPVVTLPPQNNLSQNVGIVGELTKQFDTNVKEPPKFTVEEIEKLNSELEKLNASLG